MKTPLKICLAIFVSLGLTVVVGYSQEVKVSAKPATAEELRTAADNAQVIVVANVKSVRANTVVSQRLCWEITCEATEIVKGKLAAKEFKVHVESPVDNFGMLRAQMPGHSFVLPLSPLHADADALRFILVGERAYSADSEEAKTIRGMVEEKPERPSATDLKLTIEPAAPSFRFGEPVLLKVRLTNQGKDSVTYLQAPILESENVLYLAEQASLGIRDQLGRDVPDKGTVVRGAPARGKPTPAFILPDDSFSLTVDVSKYYEMGREGNYTVALTLPTPDGNGRIQSNEATLRVGPTRPDESATGQDSELVQAKQEKPGEAVGGLCGLLKPLKRKIGVGEPVLVELRLTNVEKPVLNVDTRLERTLTIYVRELEGSPPVRTVRQVIAWPQDKADKQLPLACLVKDAFWGSVVNVNSLWGTDESKIAPPSAATIAGSGPFSYEKFGKTLFSFEKAGTYEISATYQCHRDGGGSTPNLWTGTLTTNTTVITIVDKRETPAVPKGQ